MSTTQIVAVALCTVINMVDGFEILIAASTGPGIAREWGLSSTELGLLFSSALAGMTVGALALSPLADHWGRRRTVLLSLVIITAGMMLSAVATGLHALMAARGLTGIGVGAMMPTINTVVAEFANRKRHDFSVCVQGTGFPLGGALAAVFVYLASDLSWRWVFFAGGMFSLLLIPAVFAWMPESFEFLIERRPRHTLKRLNRLLGKLGLPEVGELPALPRKVTLDGAGSTLWQALGIETVTICTTFFLLMFTFYFITNWTPKLLTDYGLSRQMGVSGAALMNIGGVVGDLVFAALVVRWPAYRVGPVFMTACFLTTVVFAFVPMQLDVLLSTALLLGFLLFGSMASLYAIVPTIYPAALRATGTGIALGLGRTGATVGPYVGGVLISMGWNREVYLIVMALPLLVCAVLTRSLVRRVLEPSGRPVAADASRM
jgi:benzoate transport